MINVSEALDSDTAQFLTVNRYKSTLVNGQFQIQLVKTFKTFGSAQPLSNPVSVLPEGVNSMEVFEFITKELIRAPDSNTNTPADVVVFKGNFYRIFRPGDWVDYGYSSAYGVYDDSFKYI